MSTVARLRFVLLLVAVLSLPVTTRAVSLDGILIYSTDDTGTPMGFDWDTQQIGPGLWRWETLTIGPWGGLGVLSGLPPDSLEAPPLNSWDFSISIPLIEGENDFTLVGATGGGNDNYQRLAVNLFFDDILEYPSISVLVPGNSPVSGGPPGPNRSDVLLTLSSDEPFVRTAASTYSDDVDTVSVIAASFRRDPAFDVSIVAPHSLVPIGTTNWIGVLRLLVEPSEAANARPPVVGPGPSAFGVNVGGDVHVGPNIVGGMPGIPAAEQPRDEPAYAAQPPPALEPTEPQPLPSANPEAVDLMADATEEPTAQTTTPPAAVTPSPSVAATAAPTTGASKTPALVGTPSPSAATPHTSPTEARGTTTPNLRATPSPAPSLKPSTAPQPADGPGMKTNPRSPTRTGSS